MRQEESAVFIHWPVRLLWSDWTVRLRDQTHHLVLQSLTFDLWVTSVCSSNSPVSRSQSTYDDVMDTARFLSGLIRHFNKCDDSPFLSVFLWAVRLRQSGSSEDRVHSYETKWNIKVDTHDVHVRTSGVKYDTLTWLADICDSGLTGDVDAAAWLKHWFFLSDLEAQTLSPLGRRCWIYPALTSSENKDLNVLKSLTVNNP